MSRSLVEDAICKQGTLWFAEKGERKSNEMNKSELWFFHAARGTWVYLWPIPFFFVCSFGVDREKINCFVKERKKLCVAQELDSCHRYVWLLPLMYGCCSPKCYNFFFLSFLHTSFAFRRLKNGILISTIYYFKLA